MKKEDILLYQSPVLFIDEMDTDDPAKKHTYWLGDKQLQGITQTLLVRALGDPYEGMKGDARAEANKQAAATRGHNIHRDVQDACESGMPPMTLECQNFLREIEQRGWQVIANEYVVSDEDIFASSIDLLFLNEYGELCIGDLKTYAASTAKQQTSRVALQCAIYNLFFSLRNNYEVKHHYEIRLREDEVDIIELPTIAPEIVGELIKAYKEGDDKYEYNDTPDWYYAAEDIYEELMKQKEEVEHNLAALKKKIMEKMTEGKTKTLRNRFTASIVKGRTTSKVDEAKLQEEHPEIAVDYFVQTFDSKAYIKAAKTDELMKSYITETTGEETIRIA